MKKLLLSIVFSVFYISTVSADMGVNIGVSGNAGIFAASGHEKMADQANAGEKNNGTEHGSAGWGSIFLEGTLNDRFMIGIDYVPAALETDTTESARSDKRTAGTETITASTNKIQIDFENLTTVYAGVMLGEHFYAKAGLTTVEVITNEALGTGGAYGNTDLDGNMFGVGYNYVTDNGAFIRVEGNYMSFDSATLTNANNSDVSVKLRNLDGVSGKVSVGKSF